MLATNDKQLRTEGGWIGRGARRFEDARFVTGAGRYVDDLSPEGCLHLAILRSPYARGAIVSLDVAAARSAAGVVAVLTGTDVAGLGQAAVNPLIPGVRAPRFCLLAQGEVSAVGQPIAAVIAETESAAQDALQLIAIEIDAQAPRAGDIDDEAMAQRWRHGDVDERFRSAAHVARVRIQHARVAPSPLEPRAALAEWDAAAGALTAWLSTQTPHRAKQDLARILGLPGDKIRVIAPDVGGAFGGKSSLYPEDALVAFAARHVGRAVKWRATRGDDLQAATHGRGGTSEGELALDADGRILGLRARLAYPLGHWLPYSATVPGRNASRILPGPYLCDAIDIDFSGRLTNTAAMGIYRGAGRPEAAMLMERLMDESARLLDLDPLEIRRRNLIPADAFPYRTPTGETLDSGNYPELLQRAAERARYDDLRAAQRARRARGDIVGLGAAFYIEPCGQGWEAASISLRRDGMIVGATGASAQGQGRETAFAQIIADALGVDIERVIVRQGDTDDLANGVGALASRSTAIGGSAMMRAAQAFGEKARVVASQLLNCSTDLVAPVGDGFIALDARGAAIDWRAVATRAAQMESDQSTDGMTLATSITYHADGEAWSSGCCIASVSIDGDTGVSTIEDLIWVDDAGVVINPMLVRGQLIGGMAQGVGEAMMEQIVYDESGQLLSGSLMDYAMPRATDIPSLTLDKLETPSPVNALGAKGVGEAGCIGVPAAIVNAVVDALSPYGVTHLDMPLTSQKIWKAIAAATHESGETAP